MDPGQVIELYTDDGMERPFFATLATPWSRREREKAHAGTLQDKGTAALHFWLYQFWLYQFWLYQFWPYQIWLSIDAHGGKRRHRQHQHK